MNANEFEGRLNALMLEGVKALDSNSIKPADIVFALEAQKAQFMGFIIMRAQQQAKAQQQTGIIVPRNGQIPPNLGR